MSMQSNVNPVQKGVRYIAPRHTDYREQVLENDETLPCYLEFNCYEDEKRAKSWWKHRPFYHFELGNLTAAKNIDFEEYEWDDEKTSEEFKARFQEQTARLESGEIDHFIEHLFFKDSNKGEWTMSPCPAGKTLFDLCSKKGGCSYYAVIYVSETARLTPDVLCRVMERFSPVWFGDTCRYQVVE